MGIELNINQKLSPRFNHGFSLIELVITITLIMIIFSITGIFIASTMRGYANIAMRGTMVDAAEIAIRRIERDIHQALPNSIRVKSQGSMVAIEMVNVVEALRYRTKSPGGNNAILDTDASDTQFNTLATFASAQLGNNGYRLVIYNTGARGATTDEPVAGANVYALSAAPGSNPPIGSHVITPLNTTVTLSNVGSEGHVVLSNAFQFAFQSPMQRVYVVDTPISYICDLSSSSSNITQYKNYSLWETQAVSPAVFPLSAATPALLAERVVGCVFDYQAGTSQRNGMVTIQLTIGSGTEHVTLLHQVGVTNAP